jgi:cellulose biosynthesis protein BcsQ
VFITETAIPDEIPPPPIITLFSSMAQQECILLSLGLARAFTLSGFKTILIDWNFNFPMLSFLIEQSGFPIEEPNLSNYYTNPDLSLNPNDLIELCIKIPLSENLNLLFFPTSTEPAMIRTIEKTEDKIIRKNNRRITKTIRKLQEENQFDVMIINSQNIINRDTINSLLMSTANFCITQHDQINLNMTSKIIDNLIRINPLLRVHGLILNNYHNLPTPIGNRQKIAKLEHKIEIPIIGGLINLTNFIQSSPMAEILKKDEWELDEYMNEFSSVVIDSAVNPRQVESEIPLILHSLFVLDKSGLPLYTYSFPDSRLTEETLASAGLTAVVSGLAQLVSELVRRRQITNLIDLSGVKVFVEEDKKIRVMLLASKFDEEIPLRLKSFLTKFLEKYHEKIKNWMGKQLEFEGIDELIFVSFGDLIYTDDGTE